MIDWITNELRYNFGGTKAAEEGTRTTKDGPTAIGRLLGVDDDDISRAQYQRELDEFKEDPLYDEARSYGVTVDRVGQAGDINRAQILKETKEAKIVDALVTKYIGMDGTANTDGLNRGQLQALIKTRQEEIDDEKYKKGLTRREQDPATIREVERNQRLELRQINSDERADKRWYADRADSRAQLAQQMEMEIMRGEREDKRFNEEQKRLDRADRRQANQALAAGLVSLGAAFAI